MKKLALSVVAGALLVSAAFADSYTIDPNHTYPNFRINHLGFTTIYGRFGATEGKIEYDPAGQKGSVEITIDATSVDTGYQKRDDHLRSPDFLNVAEFPEITFKSTAVKFDGDKPSSITGDLTILGVSKSVTLEVTSANCAEHPFTKKWTCGFDANTAIKRSDFGINYAIPGIGDDMELLFGVEAIIDG
ncbi:MAG: YceI family protein [Gammaproteobacteria bacterium]|nr:YceI family protein [Gammaproteobacteria bacterium]MDH3466946.1 YceI family protein [Gammaproteobacteria bacterium]